MADLATCQEVCIEDTCAARVILCWECLWKSVGPASASSSRWSFITVWKVEAQTDGPNCLPLGTVPHGAGPALQRRPRTQVAPA